MPKTHIARSKIINAPISKVYDAVADLAQWQAWSPWLIMEPGAKVTVADDKQSYAWEGDRVGSGHMAITEAVQNQSVRYDLTFLKPFKSTAKVGMDVRETADGTEVTWTMDSALPFFMFFMKKMMEAFVGMDYERGLNLLKDYVEDGKVHSKLNFIGVSDFAGCDYVGLKRTCTLDDMAKMQADFERLGSWAAENGLNPENMFCIYHDFNPVKNRCIYTAALPFDIRPGAIPDDFVTGSQAPTRLHSIEHIGPYEHLGNAWTTMHTMMRNKEFKAVKKYPPFETYQNSPVNTDPKDLSVRVNFAVK